MFRLLLSLLGLIIFTSLAQAHPTAFRDSLGIMGHHSPEFSHNQVNYSWRHWVATGVHHFNRPNQGRPAHATIATANFLLKRWNGPSYQGNLYAIVGAGSSELSGEAKDSGFGLVQFDIEDRKYYFLAKTLQIVNEDFTDFKQSVVRAGLAPYVGDYTDLHSWLIVEYSKAQFGQESPIEDTTPFLRFFYKNLLFEIGQSFKGHTKFNYIIHY